MPSDGDEKTEKLLRWRLGQKGGRGSQWVGAASSGLPGWSVAHQGGVRGAVASGGLTWVVSAASRGGAPPPVPIQLGEFPLLVGITGEGVRGQVADLQAGIVPQEVAERHPGKSGDTASRLQGLLW